MCNNSNNNDYIKLFFLSTSHLYPVSCPHYLKMPLISKYTLSELSHFITKDNCIRLKNERYCHILDPKKSSILNVFPYDVWGIQSLNGSVQVETFIREWSVQTFCTA